MGLVVGTSSSLQENRGLYWLAKAELSAVAMQIAPMERVRLRNPLRRAFDLLDVGSVVTDADRILRPSHQFRFSLLFCSPEGSLNVSAAELSTAVRT